MTPSPGQADAMEAMRLFLVEVLPDGVEVIAGQVNRVPEPSRADSVVMTPTSFTRLSTNVDDSEDVKFTGSITGNTLTVTNVAFGTIQVGATVFGTGAAAGTKITALDGGTGGTGAYTVNVAQTIPGQTLSSGGKSITQGAQVCIQLDFHSADVGTAGDMAQTVSTLLRDAFGVESFAAQDPPVAVPLYADDPRQAPFMNAEQQFEWRWIVEAMLQVNQTVTVPKQYADVVEVGLISVEAEYPPT